MVWRTLKLNPLKEGLTELQEIRTIANRHGRRFFLTAAPRTYIVTDLELTQWNVAKEIDSSRNLCYSNWEIAEKYSEYYATIKINNLF